MTAYAIAHLRNVVLNQGIIDYLRGIDRTLLPFGGRFLVHGGSKDMLEGQFTDDLIMIVFPGIDEARGWYDSPAYQALAPLRMQGAEGEVFIIEGVADDHKATDILQGAPSQEAA